MRRGFTLFELVVVTAIAPIVLASLLWWIQDDRATLKRRAAPLVWDASARGALDRIARDVRASPSLELREGLRLEGTEGAIRYWHEGDQLRRESPAGQSVLAHQVSAMRLSESAGLLVVELDFVQRQGAIQTHGTRRRAIARRIGR